MILRRVMWAASLVALLLAVTHLGLAAASAARWGVPLLWFAGSGLALLLAALLNLVALRAGSEDPIVRSACVLGNAAVTGFFLLAWPLLKQPQVLLGVLVFAILTLGSWLARGGTHPKNSLAGSASGSTPG